MLCGYPEWGPRVRWINAIQQQTADPVWSTGRSVGRVGSGFFAAFVFNYIKK